MLGHHKVCRCLGHILQGVGGALEQKSDTNKKNDRNNT